MSYDAYLLPSAMAEFDIEHGSPSSEASPKKKSTTLEWNEWNSVTLDDEQEGQIFHLRGQRRHVHQLGVQDLDEPAQMQRRLKRELLGSVRLHVEEEGERGRVSLGDVLQALLCARLRQQARRTFGR